MEARAAFRGSASSTNMVAIVAAVLAAFLLGAVGGYFVKTLSLPAAAASAVATHIVAGQPEASGFGTAWNYSNRHSGTQSVEGPPAAATAAPAGAQFREPTTGRSGPQS
jgi:hypothetical protein